MQFRVLVGYESGGSSASGSAVIHAVDAGGGKVTLSYFPTLTGATFAQNAGADTSNVTANFSYHPSYTGGDRYETVNFVATNGVFSDTEVVVIHILDVNAPPVLGNITTPKNLTEHVKFTMTVSATDADGGALTFSMSSTPSLAGATLTSKTRTSATFEITPSESQGGNTYNVWFKVHDLGSPNWGWDSQKVVINVAEVNDPPVLAAIGAQSVKAGVLLKFGVSATDPEGAALTLTTSTLPSGQPFSIASNGKGSFEWTPTAEQIGIDTVTFYASDGTKSDSERVSISVTSDVREIHESQLPGNFALEQNYPNPFNPSTTIEFAVPTASHVNLGVFNILGQKVITLVDQDLPAGYKSVTWNGVNTSGNQVASGIYFYRMMAKDFQTTKRLILLK